VNQFELSAHQREPLSGFDPLLRAKDPQLERQREVLRYITAIGSSLRLQMDTATLLTSVSEATCRALRFHFSVLYLADGRGQFRASASSGIGQGSEEHLRQHPVPADVVAMLTRERYRMSESYFIPREDPLWQDEYIANFFVVDTPPFQAENDAQSVPVQARWQPEDMLFVPLLAGDGTLLGFLTPDAPLDGLRPTNETLALLELFVNQAAVVIEGSRLYAEARQNSQERAALIEIGRVLSSPEAQRDLQSVYQTIYEQVRRVMPVDAFFITRYHSASDRLVMDYLVDDGVYFPSFTYSHFTERTRELLFHEQLGWLFSTAQEHDAQLMRSESINLTSRQHLAQSLLYTPIRYGEEPIGLLSAQSYQQHVYTRRHLEMLKEIGVQAGLAITNARLNTELRDALKKAQESEHLKNHFLMTASHELRTPITAIQGYIELLGSYSSVLDEEAKMSFLNNARRACEELVLLLGNVMDTSSIDQDHVSLNLGAVHVQKTVEIILEILEPTFSRERRSVQVQIDADLFMWADELRLRQVLLNIVGNALKYTPASTPIQVFAACVDGAQLGPQHSAGQQQDLAPLSGRCVSIAVRDYGQGIVEQDQARLFNKFVRLESAMNSAERGAGLGLYLCRQLVEAMGGRIWVDSQGLAGQGTTFTLALPQCAPADL
jgi:signal transduction histidine kinase